MRRLVACAFVHVYVAAAETAAQQPGLEAWGDSSSLLQADVHVAAPAALQPELGESSLDLLQRERLDAPPGGFSKPSKAKYFAAWVAPFILMAISWAFPWMHDRDAKRVPEAPVFEGSQQAAVEPARFEPVRETADVVRRIGPLWVPIILGALSGGISGPSGDYIGVNFFARHHTSLPRHQVHCELNPQLTHCRQGVMDITQVHMYLGLVAPIVQIILGPALGCLSDAYGRRPVLVAVSVLHFIPYVFTACHMYHDMSLWVNFLLVPLSDLPSGAVSYAYTIDMLRDPSSLAFAFGLMTAADNLFRLIGLVIGSKLTLMTAFTTGFIISSASLAYQVLILPESLRVEDRKPLKTRFLVPGFALGILVRNSLLARLTYFAMFAHFLDAGFNAIIGNWLQLYLKWTMKAGYNSAILGSISQIVWLTFGMSALVRHIGEAGVLNVSRWLALVMGISILFSTQVWNMYVIQAVLRGAVAMSLPCIAAIKGKLIPASEQGHLQSCLNTMTSVTASLGPLAFGVIFRTTNNVHGIRTKESNATLYYGILLSVPLLLVLLTLPRLMRKYLPSDGKPVEKQGKLIQ